MSVKRGEVSLWSLIEGSNGVETSLAPRNPESCRRSKQYFLWQREIPLCEWATSSPKKYFRVPISLILKAWCKTFLMSVNSESEFAARMISST